MNEPRSLAPYFRELEGLRRRLEAFLDRALVAREYAGGEEVAPGTWSPPVDLLEGKEEYLLFAELPGVERSEIDLEVNRRRVVLSGRRPPPETRPASSPETSPHAEPGNAVKRSNFHRMERSHGPFRRVFELDKEVRADRVEAKLTKGVLEVRLPKLGAGARQIVVDGSETEVGGEAQE